MSDAPMRIGESCDAAPGTTCACCAGTRPTTPRPVHNRPGLTAVAYRAGDHCSHKASMLSGLGTAAAGSLGRLGTRADDDFTVALIDAFACVCDVLGFYQERLANEGFLGTVTERASLMDLVRLIGYRPQPGSAAETDLVLSIEDPPGAVADVAAVRVPRGTRVQSQPGPDETPQVFETLDDLDARLVWNALAARRERHVLPAWGDRSTWLQGMATGLAPGDAILIVGRQRSDAAAPDFDVGSERWDFRRVVGVTPLPEADRTLLTWDRPLGSVTPFGLPAQADQRIFHLRDRASLFGFNAPKPGMLTFGQRAAFPGAPAGASDWGFGIDLASRQLHLDAIYPGFVEGGWAVVTWPGANAELYRITGVTDDGLARYGLSGRATLLTLDTDEGLAQIAAHYRAASVYGRAIELAFAATPLVEWVAGASIELDSVTDLPEGRRIILTGRRATVAVARADLTLAPGRTVSRGALLTLLSDPETRPDGQLDWFVRDVDGAVFVVTAHRDAFVGVRAPEDAETIAERAELARLETADPAHSRLVLHAPVHHAFDRATVRIHGNVAPAGHGEGVSEILGSGDPAWPFQRFMLKQAPITHVLADTETGVASSLTVRVDGVQWTEAADLHQRAPGERVFTTRQTGAGETVVQFGDGRSGARPTPGRDNVVAAYRQGLGVAGNVRSGQASLLLDRPLGLKAATNPLHASGGADAETLEGARRNAPIHTLTLGRVVSITDYRDFALGYPGVAQAEAHWVWGGRGRRVVVSVAGANGAALTADGPTLPRLLSALRTLGDPLTDVDVVSYVPSHFLLGLRVAVRTGHAAATVLTEVEAALHAAFSFETRAFAQPVTLSAVAAAAHEVAGVQAVHVTRLYRAGGPQSSPAVHPILAARPARLEAATFHPAEILTLAPGRLERLEVLA